MSARQRLPNRRARPEQRPTFVLTLQAAPGVDAALAVRALRRFVKIALRSFRLRCICVEEVRR
jgi:hypothetical protein